MENIDEVTKIIALTTQELIAYIGGTSILFTSILGWLGKIWASRIIEKDRSKYNSDLEQLRLDANVELEKLRNELNILKEKDLRGLNDKILMYRRILDIIAEVLADFDYSISTNQPLSQEKFNIINRERLKAYGYLAMMSPQSVMDAHDDLIDYIIQIQNENENYDWDKTRNLALIMLNEMRKDLGFDISPIAYNGVL